MNELSPLGTTDNWTRQEGVQSKIVEPCSDCADFAPGSILRIQTGTRYSVWKVTGKFPGAADSESYVTLKRLDQVPGVVHGQRVFECVVPWDILKTHSKLDFI